MMLAIKISKGSISIPAELDIDIEPRELSNGFPGYLGINRIDVNLDEAKSLLEELIMDRLREELIFAWYLGRLEDMTEVEL